MWQCVVGAALARPSRLDGLEHSHDARHHHEAHALPESQLRALEPEPEYREPVGPPQPYQFTYQAGRYPNHVDRTHRSVQSEHGTVHRGDAPALDTARVSSPYSRSAAHLLRRFEQAKTKITM